MADFDPRAAKRAERQVLVMLGLSALGTIFFIVAYFAVPLDGTFATLQVSNITLGLGLGFGIFFIGTAAVHLAKTLMPDTEMFDERHPQRGTKEERDDAAAIMVQSGQESGLGRRPFILGGLVGAAALAPLPAVVLLRDLGPLPGDALAETLWDEGVRLALDPSAEPILASDVTLGSVFHVIPENLYESDHFLDEKAKAAVLIMRVDPDVVEYDEDRVGWDVDGIYAFSKICTHVGCPVALYEQQTHHLLCPCHQSTFDLTQHCKVIFGPAKRALPQLPISVDDEGYLVAQSDFLEPPGPSYWERG
ncbi:Rieske 2Fe-2S domain-containing protein [uncultured Pseudokineococcus sp.]|uniref:cytochrome bc1 complex Rieske iron-sulfur subunit n=1 Tax=uncultured Pseudokineococcus sp. TaxID=1642928 RepID=UPI00341726F6